MNTNKTKFLFIGSRHCISQLPENLSIKANSEYIKPSENVKNLGITMDRYLSFDNHVENMYTKASGVLYFLHKNKDHFDKESRKIVVEALVNSIVSYCSTIWNGSSWSNLQKIQKIQNFASKVAVGRGRRYDHATPYINELKWLKIENKKDYDICLFVHRVLQELIPSRILPLETVEQVRSRQTRQGSNLLVRRRRTMIADRATSVRGPRLWNALPRDIRECEILSIFKGKLKSHLLLKQQ